mgnify:CR=1 FL=1
MVRLTQHYKLAHIIVVDDMTAKSAILKSIFEKSAMPGMKITVTSRDNFVEPVKAAVADSVSTMVVFRFPPYALTIFEKVPELPKSLMVGPVQIKDNGKEVNTGTFVSAEYADNFRKLAEEMGIDVYFQITPEQRRYEWADIKKKLG